VFENIEEKLNDVEANKVVVVDAVVKNMVINSDFTFHRFFYK
jgi:hypothetical protein